MITFWVLLSFVVLNAKGDADSRIVGGERSPKNYPYQISLQIKPNMYIASLTYSPDGWAHNCGGSIVSQTHVVTAAHCLAGYNTSGLSIWAGTTKLNGNGTRYFVSSFIIHPDYVQLNTSDIGIITLTKAFVYSDTIQPIKYSDETIGGGVQCTLTGWGYVTMIRFGRPPNDMQRINLTTITNDECNRNRQYVDDTGICTQARIGRGACGGDSGGPLARDDLLVGVVSYGTSVCAIGVPDVYTRVSVFSEWIANNTMETGDSDYQ